jgi:hypothetical protein
LTGESTPQWKTPLESAASDDGVVGTNPAQVTIADICNLSKVLNALVVLPSVMNSRATARFACQFQRTHLLYFCTSNTCHFQRTHLLYFCTSNTCHFQRTHLLYFQVLNMPVHPCLLV